MVSSANATDNVARLRRLLLEGFSTGNMSVVDDIVAERFVEHQAEAPQGREGLKNTIRSIRQAFPDLNYTVVQMAADGDKTWGHFRARGTQRGMFMGHPPTGKAMDIDIFAVVRFDNGMIVEHWGVPDRLTAFHQLGLLSAKAA